jgi:AcrB/AcrD/AcrF family protein
MSLVDLCVRRPVFATMPIVALVVLGLASYRDLGLDIFPKVDIPTVTVTTRYREEGEQYDVRLRLAERIRRTPAPSATSPCPPPRGSWCGSSTSRAWSPA